MLVGLFKICLLFSLHFIVVKCLIKDTEDLSVRILDKKLIERKRQDTRDMCRIFNAEALKTIRQTTNKFSGKYDKRKKDIKAMEKKKVVKEKSVIANNKTLHRPKRSLETMHAVNPAMNEEDEQRVETIVDRIYDDLLEKGQKITYRRREVPTVEEKGDIAANKSGRRFPFAPFVLVGPTTTKPTPDPAYDAKKKPRFHHGIVPYFIDSKTYDSHLAEIIMKAFDYFEKATCIRLQRLRERPTDLQSLQNVIWLYITNPSGIRQCVHSNDRVEIKGVQMIVFGYDCMSLGDITHEIMHVLGFAHEHIRPDRDQYITILWDNIKPGYRKYFEVQNNPIFENLPYDYGSILHYPSRAFSKNGQVTIMTEPGIKVGQREGLSEMDIEKVSMLYTNECVKRNREYLLKTCPSVVKSDTTPKPVPQEEIDDYFKDRLWPYGVVNYRYKDKMEFTAEEIQNINSVIRHLEKETCIEFHDLTSDPSQDNGGENTESDFSQGDSIEKFVQLGSIPNGTKPKLPDLPTDDSRELHPKGNEIDDLDPTARKGVKSTKTKASNMLQKKTVSRVKRAIKRAVTKVPAASRRHANSIVVVERSPQPGCICPRPGKPEGAFMLYVVKINADCFNSVNDLLHLFVHVLGLDHQHNMHDRDSYLHIVWDQLTEDIKNEMKKKLPPAASAGFSYDYQSVMHYPWLQIKNGRTNIMYPIWNDGWAMGHWQGLSSTDVQKLNFLYFKQCVERKQHADEASNSTVTSQKQ